MEAFEERLRRWDLRPDGDPIATPSSQLLPVRRGEVLAMLKVPRVEEERLGGALMPWWDGDGAARAIEWDADALLLERARGGGSLADMAIHGGDDKATRIVCEVAARLHAPQADPPSTLVPLGRWFAELEPGAARYEGVLRAAWDQAQELLADPQDVVPLHGDLQHGNVLDFGERGWLAIDPKGLLGERGFDYANLFCNPSVEVANERFERRLDLVSEIAGLDRRRLLRWVLAWAGLSAAWTLGNGSEADLSIANRAAAELNRP